MFNRNALKGLALGLGLPLLLAALAWPDLASPGVASAAVTNAVPGAARPIGAGFSGGSPLVIPAAAFSSDGFDPDNYRFWFSTGAVEGRDSPPTGNPPCLKAPVYLPNWAEVYQFWASIYDNDISYNVPVLLRRVSNYDGLASVTMASVSSSGSSTTIQSVGDYTIDSPIIYYPDYSYYATVCLNGSDTKLYSARIWYTEKTLYLPLITR
jgi:hypothetical protein